MTQAAFVDDLQKKKKNEDRSDHKSPRSLYYAALSRRCIIAKTGRYIHQASNTTPVTAIGTAFNGAKVVSISLNENLASDSPRFSGRIESVAVRFSSISTAASVTMRGISDGYAILSDTTATIDLTVGSSTSGSIMWIAGVDWISDTDSLSLMFKTDAGTVTVSSVVVTWSE